MDNLWMKIGAALLIGMMILVLWPRSRQMVKESPKGSGEDWRGFIMILAVIALFVAVLVMLV